MSYAFLISSSSKWCSQLTQVTMVFQHSNKICIALSVSHSNCPEITVLSGEIILVMRIPSFSV